MAPTWAKRRSRLASSPRISRILRAVTPYFLASRPCVQNFGLSFRSRQISTFRLTVSGSGFRSRSAFNFARSNSAIWRSCCSIARPTTSSNSRSKSASANSGCARAIFRASAERTGRSEEVTASNTLSLKRRYSGGSSAPATAQVMSAVAVPASRRRNSALWSSVSNTDRSNSARGVNVSTILRPRLLLVTRNGPLPICRAMSRSTRRTNSLNPFRAAGSLV